MSLRNGKLRISKLITNYAWAVGGDEREKRWFGNMVGCFNTKENGTTISPRFIVIIQWNCIECWRELWSETWNNNIAVFFNHKFIIISSWIYYCVRIRVWLERTNHYKIVCNENLCAKQWHFCLIKNETESLHFGLIFVEIHWNSRPFSYCANARMLANRVNSNRTSWGDFSTTVEYNNVYLHFVILFHSDYYRKHEWELFQSLQTQSAVAVAESAP